MSKQPEQGSPLLWTREGFAGPASVVARRRYPPDFHSVEGPCAPRRVLLEALAPPDAGDEHALPMVVATSRAGVRLLTSARQRPMPFTVRNAEADELHFLQSGRARFDTEVGSLEAQEEDFVYIPRAVAYRVAPVGGPMRSLILESPSALALTPPSPLGMLNAARDVHPAKVDPDVDQGGPARLVLRSGEAELTTFVLPHDPLALVGQLSATVPVFKVNLRKIQLHTYEPHGGPPSSFMTSRANDVQVFNFGSRSGGRPPVHLNADFDEVILYVRGPGAWGACTQPGTLTVVPKGVPHHGPLEAVPEGYQAVLLETRASLRWTPEALGATEVMETGNYGRHVGPRG